MSDQYLAVIFIIILVPITLYFKTTFDKKSEKDERSVNFNDKGELD